MTLSKKLKQLRSTAGMSQEHLADRLDVSRQAVAKWESGAGMPDIDNLQQLANIFGVRLDELLDYKKSTVLSAVREPVEQKDFAADWQDSLIREKYPAAQISQLVRVVHMVWWKKLLEISTVGVGAVEMFDSLNSALVDYYYLVEQQNRQWIVQVNKEYIECSELLESFVGKKMLIEGYMYKKMRALDQ